MDYLVDDYDQALSPLRQCNNISSNLINDLLSVLYKLHQQNRFSKPMPWIGIYIAVASLGCILAMVADLIHALKNRIPWLPCKYFTLNAVSLTVMAVAVKLPMDLTNPMTAVVDQQAKLGSVAFMCIIMTFLLPSIATMRIKELVTNVIALGLLVITLVVNVGIQINTGLFSYSEDMHTTEDNMGGHTVKKINIFGYANREIAIIYVAMLLVLLMIYICSAPFILAKNQMIISVLHLKVGGTLVRQNPELSAEGLKKSVIKHGIMAAAGKPQLILVTSATSSASAVICVLISCLHLIQTFNNVVNERRYKAYDSDYKWSTLVILIIQSIGITLGAIALLCRFFAPILVTRAWNWKKLKFYKVGYEWTETLSDWKHITLYLSSSPNFVIVFYRLQFLGLKAFVITCKLIRIIPLFLSMCVFQFVFRLVSRFGTHRKPETNIDIQGRNGLNNHINESVERWIQNAEKKQPSELMTLLEKFRAFEGVIKFDSLLVQLLRESPCAYTYSNCWSLPVVTLATIALSLRKNEPSTLKNLLNGVNQGLIYVKLVETTCNKDVNDETLRSQKAAEYLWVQVVVYHKWLGNNLHDPDFRVKKAIEIVRWFNKEAGGNSDHNICSRSMYQITKKLLSYIEQVSQDNIEQVSQEDLFTQLSSMISDILAACLTNLSRVIILNCLSTLEKGEESIHAAATLLGKTSKIINTLKDRVPRSLIDNPDALPYIDKWCDCLTAPDP